VRARDLSVWGFLAIVVVYLAIVQGAGLLLRVDTHGAATAFPTAHVVVREGLIPIGLSALFAAGVVTWLGWWRAVLHDDRPVRPWARRVPVTMIVVALLATNYPHLANQDVGLVATLIIMVALVGFTEELMFRGLGVVVLRRNGFPEARVALWSSLIFGAVHLSNAIGHGGTAIAQAAVVATTGYFFYISRRAFGTILIPMLTHALWDFSLLSSFIGDDTSAYPPTFLVLIAQVAIIIALFRHRHRIEPAASAQPS
jgi:uncharacterized protein